MPIPRYNAATDKNQSPIVEALKAVGCTVYYIKLPVDLLVGYRGKNYLLEVKQAKEKKTAGQDEFFSQWRGQKELVRTPEEALRAVGIKAGVV